MNLLWITIKYSILGTFFGSIMALITSLFASQEISQNKFVTKFISILITVFRALPIPFVMVPFAKGFQKELSAFLIIFWFTWMWLHKFFYSFLNNLDWQSYRISIIKGNSKFRSFKNNIWPHISNKYLVLFIYSFESNIRWTTIISSAGVIGIGSLLQDAQDPTIGWSIVGIPLVVLLVFTIFLDTLGIIFNKFIINKKSLKVANSSHFTLIWIKKNYDKLFKILLVFCLLIINLISIIQIKDWSVNSFEIKNFFQEIFDLKWELFAQGSLDNPFYMMWNLIAQLVITFAILTVFSIFFAFLSNEKMNKMFQWALIKTMLNIFRIIPITIFFYLFISLSFIPPLLFVAVLVGFKSSINLGKKLNESINSIDWNKYKLLKIKGWSRTKLLLHYVFPSIKKEYFKYLSSYVTNIMHDLLVFGLVGGSLLGQKIITLNSTTQSGDTSAFVTYAWSAWLLIITIEIIVILFQFNYFEKLQNWWKVYKFKAFIWKALK
ncbi:Putative ABC transport system permease protein [Mesomycoplasma conjunctivae]|uniref:ABC transport system permease protein n=2 Tax=Mesomycoplasma conjunctivae TaxID=45361 RepID=C5J5K0_MESCH|nr:Putative ABC transport system permease protein [Mesomycoplasma conjunctivae]